MHYKKGRCKIEMALNCVRRARFLNLKIGFVKLRSGGGSNIDRRF